MRKVIDARGLSCPHPVAMTRNALNNSGIDTVLTIVDNKADVENIYNMVKEMHMESIIDQKEDVYYINIHKAEEFASGKDMPRCGTALMIGSNLLGQGDSALGVNLMKNFIYNLTQAEMEISQMLFMNSGVLLTTDGSELIEPIRLLEVGGVEILSCDISLDYYGLSDKLKVGQAASIFVLTERLLKADKVISF